MSGFDLIQSLVDMGIDEKIATDLKSRLHGDDLINLVDALNRDELGTIYASAEPILRKYNIKLGGKKQMEEYERAEFEALKNGDVFAVQNFINEWLTPVSVYSISLKEGFNYAVEVNERTVDRVLDWLDENKVEYQANTPTLYHIKCEDRATAYRVSRALSEIMGKPLVRDDIKTEEELMSEKKSKGKMPSKEQLAKMQNRNPVVSQMVQRGGAGAHKDDRRKADTYGRGAKHKGKRFDEDCEFAIGDDVMVGEQQGTIKIPRGPNGTVGVILDGELSMVAECDVSRLDEGVMGMTKLNPLFRLRELAGLAPAPAKSPEDELMKSGPLAPGPVDAADLGFSDEIGDLDDTVVDADLSDPVSDFDDMVDPAGVPGDLPPVAAEPALVEPTTSQSDAMCQIEDSLNSIQGMLSDIRLSEYKTLVQKLTDLTTQVQNMGRDYLGERRKK